jgi:integrative and conjugative element protein (TIGR02256 family)
VLSYPLDDGDASLVFSDDVVAHFTKHQQRRSRDTEAGGQLFARLSRFEIYVEVATGPRPGDKRTRTSYVPDRIAERAEIENMFDQGLHFVGDWHTHPESIAHPSLTDEATITDCASKSKHKLNGFILVVIGNGDLPTSMSVSVHAAQEQFQRKFSLKRASKCEYMKRRSET